MTTDTPAGPAETTTTTTEAPPAAQGLPTPQQVPGPRGETPLVPAVGRQRSVTHGDARATLREAFRRPTPAFTPPQAATSTNEATPAPGDTGQTSVVSSAQETSTGGPPPAAPSPSPAPAEASAAQPAPGEPPSGEPSSESVPSPAPTPATPPTPPTPAGTAPPTGEASRTAVVADELPERFLDPEHLGHYQNDPLLRGNLRRLWLRKDLPEYEKGIRMDGLVKQSAQRLQERTDRQAHLRRLRDTGQLSEWANAQIEDEQAAEQSQDWAQGVTRILASAYGVDPADPAFTSAGQGTSPEEQVAHFADWAEQRSPRNQAYVQRALSSRDTEWQARWDAREAEHQQALKALEERLQGEAEASATEREAQARGGLPAPPRQPAGATALGPPSWQPVHRATILGNLSQGYRDRRGQRAQQ